MAITYPIVPYDSEYARAGRGEGPRFAADALVSVLPAAEGRAKELAGGLKNGLRGFTSWNHPVLGRLRSPGGLAVGGGLAVLGGLLAAGNELANPDPTRTTFQNTATGVGAGLGTTGGATVGAILGGMTPLGPIGSLVGSAIGGALMGEAGKGLGNAFASVLEGSPEDRALRSARRQQELATQLEADRLKTLLPIQNEVAKVALANKLREVAAMNMLGNEQRLRETLSQQMLMAQQQSGQQNSDMARLLMGSLV